MPSSARACRRRLPTAFTVANDARRLHSHRPCGHPRNCRLRQEQDEPSIPSDDAQALQTLLDQTAADFDHGACNGAHTKVAQLTAKIDQLPSSVDPTVRKTRDGAVHLNSLLTDQCKRPETTTTVLLDHHQHPRHHHDRDDDHQQHHRRPPPR